ncbi:hypothetical protein AVEN_4133-1 [Araneus ventricosus]|uniref:Uncharacterized protein n=1 Tax=Araneus ventricosus TaxID=182803 RepID=A0A4Y2LCE5_ARAVE|nr:hypothetical protein AVEN_4133-1 [Araneus ventricosus]
MEAEVEEVKAEDTEEAAEVEEDTEEKAEVVEDTEEAAAVEEDMEEVAELAKEALEEFLATEADSFLSVTAAFVNEVKLFPVQLRDDRLSSPLKCSPTRGIIPSLMLQQTAVTTCALRSKPSKLFFRQSPFVQRMPESLVVKKRARVAHE